MTFPSSERETALRTPGETAQLEALVRTRLSGRIQELRVIQHGPGLIIRGRVRTYYVKQLAQHVVMETAKLPIVANEIEVDRS